MNKVQSTLPAAAPYPSWQCSLGIDPLLVWGVATAWADFPVEPGERKTTLAIKFKSPFFPSPGSPSSGQGNFVFHAFSLKDSDFTKFFNSLYSGQKNSDFRLELAMPMGANRGRDSLETPLQIKPSSRRQPQSEHFFGVIDDGCPYARPDLVRTTGGIGTSRVLYLWDQGSKKPGAATIPYGCEVDLSVSKLVRVGEDEVYSAAGYEAGRRANTHGAHVLSLLAAKKTARHRLTAPSTQNLYLQKYEPKDVAAEADIGFVQLPVAAIGDTSGLWLTHFVLDAIDYLLAAAVDHKVVVLNISYGPLQGPHDGTSFFEEALDAKIQAWCSAHKDCRLEVVLPSGNNFNTKTHAALTVTKDKPEMITWFVPPNSEKSGFVEIWANDVSDPAQVKITLTSPAGAVVACSADEAGYLRDSSGGIYAGVIFTKSPARSTTGLHALLVTSPTDAPTNQRALAPSGRWQIEIRNTGVDVLEAHAYIARNGVTLLRKNRGKQSYFLDELYDPDRFQRPAQDDAISPPSKVKRRGTLSGIATGSETLIASGYRMRNVDHPDFSVNPSDKGPDTIQDHSGYSSAGPGRGRFPRDPDVSAPTDYSWLLKGLPAGGGRGRAVFWMTGTSTAAPQVARALMSRSFSQIPLRQPLSGTFGNGLFSAKYIL
jgi:Subtilase family